MTCEWSEHNWNPATLVCLNCGATYHTGVPPEGAATLSGMSDLVLDCQDCEAVLTRDEYEQQLGVAADLMALMPRAAEEAVKQLDFPVCPACGSERVLDHRTPEDRAHEREVFTIQPNANEQIEEAIDAFHSVHSDELIEEGD